MNYESFLSDLKWLSENSKPSREVIIALATVEAFVLNEKQAAETAAEMAAQPVRRFYKVVSDDSDCL
jgi:hypothetical protein